MKKLGIKVTGGVSLDNAEVLIDGKPVTLKRNKFGNLTYQHETNEDKVKVQIRKYADIGGPIWFILQLFFFLISIFGIFDNRYRNRGLYFIFELDVDLKEDGELTLKCKPSKENSTAIEVESQLNTTVIENSCVVEEKSKKKLKWLKIAKILLAIAVVATIIIVVLTSL